MHKTSSRAGVATDASLRAQPWKPSWRPHRGRLVTKIRRSGTGRHSAVSGTSLPTGRMLAITSELDRLTFLLAVFAAVFAVGAVLGHHAFASGMSAFRLVSHLRPPCLGTILRRESGPEAVRNCPGPLRRQPCPTRYCLPPALVSHRLPSVIHLRHQPVC